MSRQFSSFVSLITMSGLLSLISQPVCIGMSHKIVTSSLSVAVWGSCSYHFSFVLMLNSKQNVPMQVCGRYPATDDPAMVSWNRPYIPHGGSVPSLTLFRQLLVLMAWSRGEGKAMIKPSVQTSSVVLSHFVAWSTSFSPTVFGYCMRLFSSHGTHFLFSMSREGNSAITCESKL